MEVKKLQVDVVLEKPLSEVWEFWTKPEHITKWNFANEDWHCPKAENDLKEGGKFSYTMASKDGKMSFDLVGSYNKVVKNEEISYSLEDGRKVTTYFTTLDDGTKVSSSFEAENTNSLEMQQSGWQAILNNFKKYAEQQ